MVEDRNQDTGEVVDSDEVVVVVAEDKPMTAKQFNSAITAKEKAFEKRLEKQQADFLKTLQGLAPEKKEEPALSRTAELEKTIKELSKNVQDRDARDKTNNLRTLTERALKEHGVDPEFTDHALAFLVDAKKAVRYDEDGNVVMVVNGMTYDSLDEGMAAWSQTRDAKLYRKPTESKGSGSTDRRNIQNNQFKKDGTIDLKRREDADKNFSVHDPKSSLDRTSRAMLSGLLAQKLSKKQ